MYGNYGQPWAQYPQYQEPRQQLVKVTVTEQTQKVLDAISGNRMADMQNQISQLQLQQALCGVVRYPQTFAYNAGPSPFCGGCGCSI